VKAALSGWLAILTINCPCFPWLLAKSNQEWAREAPADRHHGGKTLSKSFQFSLNRLNSFGDTAQCLESGFLED